MKKIKVLKKKFIFSEDYSSDEDSFGDFHSTSSDNGENKIEEMNQEIGFLNRMQLDLSKLDVGDWIVVKFKQKKAIKMYMGQLTEKEPCLVTKFCCRFVIPTTYKLSITASV
ncbi:unnamed protein product [Psylliodes chrysocephalus]|uniref:Uncharacterized protein n=1 Tax=Psylliodes chrysocephalus TaxID=3402493 RepID=A0A9P0CU04_9CUCU|nr:unnamed protein product [Psylliodes chrysocephala]